MPPLGSGSQLTPLTRRETETRRQRFERLVLPHRQTLYRAAVALTHNTADAEDLIQETLVRAYDRFGTFREDGSARGWLHRVMQNLFITGFRKKERETKSVSLDVFGDVTENRTVGLRSPITASTEQQVLSQMEGSAILDAVRELPDAYRQVVVLADIRGLAYQDIAERMNLPLGTVRSRLNRARKRLRRALFAWRPTEFDAGVRRDEDNDGNQEGNEPCKH